MMAERFSEGERTSMRRDSATYKATNEHGRLIHIKLWKATCLSTDKYQKRLPRGPQSSHRLTNARKT